MTYAAHHEEFSHYAGDKCTQERAAGKAGLLRRVFDAVFEVASAACRQGDRALHRQCGRAPHRRS